MSEKVNQVAGLPLWQSHKRVWADKVVEVKQRPYGESLVKDDTFLSWILENGTEIYVSHELRHRGGKDPVGGYYMFYKDGYESWGPAKAMEDYTRVSGLAFPQDSIGEALLNLSDKPFGAEGKNQAREVKKHMLSLDPQTLNSPLAEK